MMLGLGVGIDYALFILARHRQNLAAGQSRPRRHRPGQRDRRTVGAVRRRHGDRRDPRAQGLRHPDDGDDGLRLGDHGRRHDAGLHHAAARDARCRQAPREQRPGPVRQAEAGLRRRRAGPPAGPPGSSPEPVRYGGSRGAGPRHPRDPGLLDAPRLRRRGQRRAGLDDPQGLRPDGRRLRPRHERPPRRWSSTPTEPRSPGRHRHRGVDGARRPAGRRLGGPRGDQRRSRHRDHRGHADDVTAGRPHRAAAGAPPAGHPPRQRSTVLASRPRSPARRP